MNPPAPLVNGNVIRVTLVTKTNDVICNNTFDYLSSSFVPIDYLGMDAFLAAFDAQETGDLQSVLSPLTTLVSLTGQELHFGTCPTRERLYAPATVGTAGATNLPLEMAVTMGKYSYIKGKHGRGRVSFPAVPNTFTTPATDSNVLNATGLAAYNAIRTGLTSAIVVGFDSYNPCISTRPVLPDTLISRAVVYSTMTLRSTLGTARRRKPGRGI